MNNSTVTRIVEIRDSPYPPAIAVARTSEGEAFPLFDANVLIDLKFAEETTCPVLLTLQTADRTLTEYIRDVQFINDAAIVRVCPWCRCPTMTRQAPNEQNGGVWQFVCDGCPRRLYLAPVKPTMVHLPAVARAAIDRFVDGIFALDHERAEAFLIDSCENDAPWVQPWAGVKSELLPHGYSHDIDNLSGVTLRLHGAPFNGQTYVVA